MKKIPVLVLSLALAFACCVPAFAAKGFDSSVLRSGKDVYVIDEDTSDGKASYAIESILANERYYHYVSDGILVFSPCVGEVDGHAMMSLCVLAFLDEAPYPDGINIREIALTIDGVRYAFSNLTDREIPLEGIRDDAVGEGSFAVLDADTMSILDKLNQNRTKTVHVEVKAETKTWEFDLSREETDSIIHLYNLFVQAGGLSDENLKWLPAGSGAALEKK